MPIPQIKKEDAIYLAGLSDGEGCIFINKKGVTLKRRYPNYGVSVDITNTNKPVMDWVAELFDSNIFSQQFGKNYKPQYSFRLTNIKAFRFLKLVSPYLKIKKRQAELALQFQEILKYRQARQWHGPPLNEIQIRRRECFKSRISALNRNSGMEVEDLDCE